MKQEVILIFDIGKTNKKALLFDRYLGRVDQHEQTMQEAVDEDGFPCENAKLLEEWIDARIEEIRTGDRYLIRGINFSTYGATLVYLDREGKRCAPIYNYLKPLHRSVTEGFYERYGGVEEFSRKTASPVLGMLNAGLQLLWVSQCRPGILAQMDSILHFPQYLSYRLTGKMTTEHTSLGCHTALWDFDQMEYHPWVAEHGFYLPEPGDVKETFPVEIGKWTVRSGKGIHDSSAALAPYLLHAPAPFMLVSTGTWCITMNPFNREVLTSEELRQDCLSFLSIAGHPVKSSRFFLGHIHDRNVEQMETYFQVEKGFFRQVQPDPAILQMEWERGSERLFFRNWSPTGPDHGSKENDPYLISNLELLLEPFSSFEEAYVRFMTELAGLAGEAVRLVVPGDDTIPHLYITGGFARNPIFTTILASYFPKKQVFTSQVDNASSLGAAMVIHQGIWGAAKRSYDLKLKAVRKLNR